MCAAVPAVPRVGRCRVRGTALLVYTSVCVSNYEHHTVYFHKILTHPRAHASTLQLELQATFSSVHSCWRQEAALRTSASDRPLPSPPGSPRSRPQPRAPRAAPRGPAPRALPPAARSSPPTHAPTPEGACTPRAFGRSGVLPRGGQALVGGHGSVHTGHRGARPASPHGVVRLS